MLNGNPLPRGRWELSDADLEKLFAAEETGEPACAAPAAPTAPQPDDSIVFHYCTVHVSGVRRPYAYLTGGLPLQVGDWVEVPFGKDDLSRCGQVSSLTACNRATAPWPPEQTKTILRVVEAPVEAEKTPEQATRPASVPKLKPIPTPEPMKVSVTEPQKLLAPKSQKPTETETAKVSTSARESNCAEKRTSKNFAPVSKRRFPWKIACVVLVFFVGAAAVAVSQWNVNRHYRQAQEYLAQSDFRSAAVELEQVPMAYQKQEVMARFADACLLAEQGTLEAYETALGELKEVLSHSDETLRPQVEAQYANIHKRYDDLRYQTGMDALQAARFREAEECLNQLRSSPAYPYASEMLCYARARQNAKSSDSSSRLKATLSALQQIPVDYDGPCAEKITAFRAQVADMIAAAEEREEEARKAEAERAAALKASGIPYVGMAEREVNSTRQLGKAYRSDTENGQKVYSWYSKANGDLVFQAKCSGGQVVSTVKYGGDAYWNGDQLLVKLGPQIIHRFNSGGASNNSHDYSVRDDYDNPEDLYEDNRDWFDDEDEAWDYWYED